jgi:tetratricopeptide (TPR) repeat protein
MSAPAPAPSPTKRNSSRRVWWLLVVLFLLLNGIAWQRVKIAGWVSQMAASKLAQGDAVDAKKWLAYAEKISPQSPLVELRHAQLSRLQGDFDAARKHLQRAKYAGADATMSDREEWLGFAQSGRMSVAEPELGRLMNEANGEEPEICLAYSLGYIRVRNFPAALTLLDAWARDYPQDPRAHAWLGQVYAELQRSADAETAFRQALTLDPVYPLAGLGLGQLLINSKQTEEAIPFLQIALDDPEFGAAAAAGIAACYQSLSRSEDAAAVLDKSLAKFPNDHRILVELANLLAEKGEYAAAIEKLQPSIDAGTKRREIRYAYATALRGVGRIEEATVHFDYAAEAAQQIAAANTRAATAATDPKNAQLRLDVGLTHLKYGNSEDGLTWIHSALELQPDLKEAHRALADYYQSRGFEDAKFLSLAQRHRAIAGPQPTNHTQVPNTVPQAPAH